MKVLLICRTYQIISSCRVHPVIVPVCFKFSQHRCRCESSRYRAQTFRFNFRCHECCRSNSRLVKWALKFLRIRKRNWPTPAGVGVSLVLVMVSVCTHVRPSVLPSVRLRPHSKQTKNAWPCRLAWWVFLKSLDLFNFQFTFSCKLNWPTKHD